MFEDSFVAERVENAGAAGRRWLVTGSLIVQMGVAGLLVGLPMLHPERLIARVSAPTVFVPARPSAPPKPVVQHLTREASAAPAPPSAVVAASAPGRIPHGMPAADPSVLPSTINLLASGAMTGSGLPAGLEATTPGPRVGVAEPDTGAGSKSPVRVSAGVTAGLLLDPIRPVYPAIAKAAHVAGDVTVAATISREGRIEGLRVVSGPAMLQNAAMDAIRRARYRPFLLNGEPTAVETTITVQFRLGG